MDKETDLHSVNITTLTWEARNLLSCLLNTTKILLSEGPYKLPRDWRGLASMVNISSEIANSYETNDKTAKVLEYWVRKKDGSSTIGTLLEFVQRIDRYDIFDDFMDLLGKGRLFLTQSTKRGMVSPRRVPNNQVALPSSPENMQLVPYVDDDDIITFDDKIHGAPQFYHAYILYAQEDREFVDEMFVRMRERGYKMCTEEDLLPDHATTFAPVSRLISSERCHRIILVYSPDFLTSPANNFYMDYAQAVGIEMKKPKIVPCMYRYCQLPPQVTFYHKLYYNPPGAKTSYDFWDRLSYSLEVSNTPSRINGLNTQSYSTVNISELPSSSSINGYSSQQLAITSGSRFSSTSNIPYSVSDPDSESISTATAPIEGKKVKERKGIRKLIHSFNFKKKKEVKQAV